MASDRTCLQIERRVCAFVAERELLQHGQKVLLMLSGGADSMALLALVRRLDQALALRPPPRTQATGTEFPGARPRGAL
jgi:3'-phosphoadenosine 5'-phosphosulfate sulfotransferase (PAPS reductase)/FAD synthetase